MSSIGEGAFYECSKLSTVSLTNSVSFIGADAFYGTAWISSQGDFAVLGDSILVSYNSNSSYVPIPEGIRQIAPNAFYENTTVNSVKLPVSLFAIGERAFMGCSALTDVGFNGGLVMIDNEAFAKCSKLKSVTTPNTLSKIGVGAFIDCPQLKSAFVRGNNVSIGYGAFASCDSLEVVLLSSDVASIADDTFKDNTKLKYVTVPPQIISVTKNAFSGCNSLTVITDEDSFANHALSGSVKLSYNRGDSDADGTVDIMDATGVQLHIADVMLLPDENLAYADADFDADLTILDATHIQLFIAKLL